MALDTGFTPEFADRLERLRAAADAAGIQTNVISGYRSEEDQRQLYANYLAGRAGKPLPYPERGAVAMAAPPGRSLHEMGLAADIQALDPRRQADLRAMASQYGLSTIGPSDPAHFQMANIGPSAAVPRNLANRGTTLNSDPLEVLARIESNNRNIPSGVDKDYPGQPGSKSQGFWQIDTPTWQQYSQSVPGAAQFPNAMSAPRDVQASVAATIPLSRFGPRTQTMMQRQFGQLDMSKPLGGLAPRLAAIQIAPAGLDYGQSVGGGIGGTTPTGPDYGSGVGGGIGGAGGSGAQAPPVVAGPQAAPGSVVGALGGIGAASGSSLAKQGMDNLQNASGKQQLPDAPPLSPAPPVMARNISPLMSGPPGQPNPQVAAQQMAALLGPSQAAWGSNPPGANAAPWLRQNQDSGQAAALALARLNQLNFMGSYDMSQQGFTPNGGSGGFGGFY